MFYMEAIELSGLLKWIAQACLFLPLCFSIAQNEKQKFLITCATRWRVSIIDHPCLHCGDNRHFLSLVAVMVWWLFGQQKIYTILEKYLQSKLSRWKKLFCWELLCVLLRRAFVEHIPCTSLIFQNCGYSTIFFHQKYCFHLLKLSIPLNVKERTKTTSVMWKAHDGGVYAIELARVLGGAPQLISIGADKTLAVWDTVSFKVPGSNDKICNFNLWIYHRICVKDLYFVLGLEASQTCEGCML